MTVPAISAEDIEELPARFDWREEAPEILTPVKTQIEGTCWAYSAIACAESNLIKKGLADSDLDLSESHLMWFCSGQPAPTDPDDPCYGCTNNPYGTKAYTTVPGLGGYDPVDACLAAWQGVVPESDAAPHSAKEPLDESLRYQSIAHLQNVDYFDETDTQNTKTQLMNRGPLRWGFYVNHKYPLSEQGGYYFPDFSREELSEGNYTGGWHSVVLVGWDDNFPKENFTNVPPEDGAWIIRNSYGENYKNSDHGYIYISYYEPSLSYIVHYDFEPVTNYGAVHHYNSSQLRVQSLKSTYDLGFLVANVFEAEKPEKIAAVGLFTEAPAEPYEISVYALEPGFTNPQDGILIETVDGIAEYKGFHTVKLPQSYAVDQGKMYSVVIETTPKKNDQFYMDIKCYKKGVSYIGFYMAKNGETPVWRDCYDESYGDVCVHVYTEYEGETAQILRGDMNRDGRLTAADISLMKQAIRQPERSDLYQPAADWNGDSEINAEDARGLLSFLLRGSDQDELKIRLTGSTADKRDEAFRCQMQDAVLERVPDFDFSQFTFETNGMTYLHDKNDATKEIGKQFYFRIYYQDILLDPEQYELHIQQYYDGRFETNADFLTANMQNKLAESVAAPRIAESDAVSAAREYAASLALPDLPSVHYQPSERFGEKTALLVYSLTEGRLAYRVTDPLSNRFELGAGQSKILCGAAADIYVDAVTGEVLENRFMITKSVS